MSIGIRAPIAGLVVTMIFFPIYNKAGDMVGHGVRKKNAVVRCVPGKPIAATPLAKRLGVAGKPCRAKIVRKVTIKPVAPRT